LSPIWSRRAIVSWFGRSLGAIAYVMARIAESLDACLDSDGFLAFPATIISEIVAHNKLTTYFMEVYRSCWCDKQLALAQQSFLHIQIRNPLRYWQMNGPRKESENWCNSEEKKKAWVNLIIRLNEKVTRK
jgi:hypothetical protein